jgi:hypothetical protein
MNAGGTMQKQQKQNRGFFFSMYIWRGLHLL